MAALVIVPGIIFLCTGFWLFASRSRVLPDPAYSRQQNSVVALFTLPPSALRGFSVFGLQHDWEITTWSSNGWERAQQFGIEGGWENNEYTLLAGVPPAKWKIELRVGLQREVRVGRRRLASFWTSNVWTSAELPPLSETEGKVK